MSSDNDEIFQKYLEPRDTITADAQELSESLEDLGKTLVRLESSAMPAEVPAVANLIDNLNDFQVRVSLIGQVKAGKTALANALLGVSNLLPSDVNPWTSVVTSFHINREPPKGKRAVFKFFDEDDWSDLISNSGRIVKLAQKAKLDTKLDELRAQIEELKNRTEKRLGKNFKLLLGNQHAFSDYNSDLIKRYVCLGDDDEQEDREGRFADLTKSAELYANNKDFAYPLTIADTPGVNDPFLVREAATLDNLGESDICIVVLSAHQALSSVDIGLMRMLKSLRSNRLIVFVNRVDELPQPHEQVQEIRTYIRDVLTKNKLDGDIPIIFGSAVWAEAAILGDFEGLSEDSVDSLAALVQSRTETLSAGATDCSNIENLSDVSGVSALRAAIDSKAWDEVFHPQIADIANRARQIAERSAAYLLEANKAPEYRPDRPGIEAAVESLTKAHASLTTTLEEHCKKSMDDLRMGMAGVYVSFIKREKETLANFLRASSNVAEWSPDTEGLRSELNQVYDETMLKSRTLFEELAQSIARGVDTAYRTSLGSDNGIKVSSVPVSGPPIPLSLMRTMSIDLRASSSFEWLKKKLDKSIYLSQFEEIAQEDFRSSLDEIGTNNVEYYVNSMGDRCLTFLAEHSTTIGALLKLGDDGLEDHLNSVSGTNASVVERLRTLREAGDILHALETADISTTPEKAIVNG